MKQTVSGRSVRGLILVVACFFGNVIQPHGFCLAEVDVSAVKEQLLPMWAGYRSEVATVDIEYRYMMLSCRQSNVDIDEFHRRFSQLESGGQEELLQELISWFRPELLQQAEKTEQPSPLWDTKHLLISGGQKRCTGESLEHVLTRDLHLLMDFSNDQVKAYRRGSCPFGLEDIDWFRTIPDDTILGEQAAVVEESGVWNIHYIAPPGRPGSWVTLSPDDGLPRQWSLVDAESGQVTRLQIFDNYAVFPGGVTFPTVRLQANFSNGLLSSIRVSLIIKAVFNQEIQPEQFNLGLPAGASWIDFRSNGKRGGGLTTDVRDMAAFFEAQTGPENDRSQIPQGDERFSWRLLLVTNGILLIGLGLWLWRRSP